jgi:hypothetical protein
VVDRLAEGELVVGAHSFRRQLLAAVMAGT